MAKWIEETTRYGWSKRLDPMPKGPYIEISQHDTAKFLRSYMSAALIFSYELKVRVGHEYYVVGLDGKPMMVAAYYDSTD